MRALSFRTFLSYAERLHRQAQDAVDGDRGMPFLIGSILTSWISLECFVNNMMQDYAALPERMFSVHERGFLEERQVVFNTSGRDAGVFAISNSPSYRRIEDKVLFLIARFGGGKVDKGEQLWQKFEKLKKKRNALSHYRKGTDIEVTRKDSEEAMELTKELIELLSSKVWKKPVRW